MMVFDKDRVLNGSDKRLVAATNTPSVATTDVKGKIVEILPGSDGSLTTVLVEAAIDAAIAAN